jgi:hypothetical protein
VPSVFVSLVFVAWIANDNGDGANAVCCYNSIIYRANAWSTSRGLLPLQLVSSGKKTGLHVVTFHSRNTFFCMELIKNP